MPPSWRLSPNDPYPKHHDPGPRAVVLRDDALSHKWDVCCVVTYPKDTAELCALKQLAFNLYCIGLSTEPVSVTDFNLLGSRVSDIFFLLQRVNVQNNCFIILLRHHSSI